MSSTLTVHKKNHSALQINCEPHVANELSDYFAFDVPGAKYMPAYKKGKWDGKVRLFSTISRELPVGLFDYLEDFARPRQYKVDVEFNPVYGTPVSEALVTRKELLAFISHLKLPFEVREYQVDAVLNALKKKRIILLSPTGSGKSLIIYVLMRWFLANESNKALVIVPTTSLVQQMYADFEDYAKGDPHFDIEKFCHRIYSGMPKHNQQERIFISTWQSIYKLPGKWFEPFGAIFGDEVHTFKAKSLTGIMNKSREAQYRFGTTGTLDGAEANKLQLEGSFGRVYSVTTTKKLIDAGTLSDLKINVLALQYRDDERRGVLQAKDYHFEMDFICTHEKRNKFVRNLAIDQEGNTLVLFQFVEKHGKPLYELIKEKAHSRRKVFYVSGEVDSEVREEIRGIVEKEKDAIIVASLGTFSTGINIKNIHNIIFASPSKSQVKVLQSIGRGLRKSEDGRGCTLYDLADDFHIKGKKNYTLLHAAERMKIYRAENFDYKVIEVNLK